MLSQAQRFLVVVTKIATKISEQNFRVWAYCKIVMFSTQHSIGCPGSENSWSPKPLEPFDTSKQWYSTLKRSEQDFFPRKNVKVNFVSCVHRDQVLYFPPPLQQLPKTFACDVIMERSIQAIEIQSTFAMNSSSQTCRLLSLPWTSRADNMW